MVWARFFIRGFIKRGPNPDLSFEGIAARAYLNAMASVGNAGQASIIETMGEDGFYEAVSAAAEGDDAVSVLMDIAAHPEAVSEILEMVGEEINDYLNGMYQASMDDEEGMEE